MHVRDTSSGSSPHRPRRSRLRRILWALAGSMFVIVAGLALAIFLAPAWYDPPEVPLERQQRVRTELVNAEQAFTQALFAGEAFNYHIYDDMVNRWIAMRRDIFPLIDRLVPALVANPSLRFRESGVTVAGACDLLGMKAVVSLDLDLVFDQKAILVRATAARCGRLPIPVTLPALRLGRSLYYEPGQLWPGSPAVAGNLLDGIAVQDRAWWNNGGIAYEVQGLTLKNGQIDLRIHPLGRHASTRDSDH